METIDKIQEPKGLVKIYKNDELIFCKHNLIVNSGRQFIQSMISKGLIDGFNNNSSSSSTNYSDYKFYRINLSETKSTTPITQLESTIANLDLGEPVLFKDLYSTGTNPATLTMDYDNRYLKIYLELIVDKLTQISDIYITINKYTSGSFSNIDLDEVLFSRVILNSLYIDDSADYKLEYYIYF